MILFHFNAMTAIDEVRVAINAALKERGGVHANYSCHFVSWDDVKRGTNEDGGLSCWGSNITDTRLCAKDGRRLFTVRSDNWNEKLGTVDASDVALIAGNTHGARTTVAPVTLRDFLRSIGEYGEYAGLSATQSLCAEKLDSKVSIRFQTTFLPISGTEGDAMEFATCAYSYGTRDEHDPKNLVVLASSQGIAVQQDQVGDTMIYHHQVGDDGNITRHWLEAEKSRHAVGQQQVETEQERQDALKRGKATSCVIGPKCVGTRFNALLTVQIPLQQSKVMRRLDASKMGLMAEIDEMEMGLYPKSRSITMDFEEMAADMDEMEMGLDDMDVVKEMEMQMYVYSVRKLCRWLVLGAAEYANVEYESE